ncbi:tubulin beta chain-like [Callospermophilus lateralis]
MWYCALMVPELTQQMFHTKNMVATCDPHQVYYLSEVTIFQGHMTMKEVDKQKLNMQNKNTSYFMEWITHNLKTTTCNILSGDFMRWPTFSATAQPSNSCSSTPWSSLRPCSAQDSCLTSEDMDQMESTNPESNMNSLVFGYPQYQDTTPRYKENLRRRLKNFSNKSGFFGE